MPLADCDLGGWRQALLAVHTAEVAHNGGLRSTECALRLGLRGSLRRDMH